MRFIILNLCWFACSVAIVSRSQAQTVESLFQFLDADDVSTWQIVNDGVMGGRSTSNAKFVSTETGETALQFLGNLSLENNGGFASVRSAASGSLGLEAGQTIVLRVKGDGRSYTFNLYTPDRRTAFSYQLDFDSPPGQWTQVRLPVNNFVAHSFGRPLPNVPLVPSQVQAIGILLGDKKPGQFEILVESISVE